MYLLGNKITEWRLASYRKPGFFLSLMFSISLGCWILKPSSFLADILTGIHIITNPSDMYTVKYLLFPWPGTFWGMAHLSISVLKQFHPNLWKIESAPQASPKALSCAFSLCSLKTFPQLKQRKDVHVCCITKMCLAIFSPLMYIHISSSSF